MRVLSYIFVYILPSYLYFVYFFHSIYIYFYLYSSLFIMYFYMLCYVYIISYTFLFSYARPRASRGSVACILCENCFCKRTRACVHMSISIARARSTRLQLSRSLYMCMRVICVLLPCACAVTHRCKLHIHYIALADILSSRSQLLNLNMQRGCHGTPRAIRLNRGSILKSRALDRSRRFRYYDACCRFVFVVLTFRWLFS